MANNYTYSIYSSKAQRLAAHFLFWIVIFILMCLVQSTVFDESLFNRNPLLFSLYYFPYVLLSHYSLCFIFFNRLTNNSWIIVSLFFLAWYIAVSVVSIQIIVFLVEEGIMLARPWKVIRLIYGLESWTYLFTHHQFDHMFSFILVYNIIAFAIKISVDFYEEQQNAYLVAKDKTRLESVLLKTQIRPTFLLNTLNYVSDQLENGHKAKLAIEQLSELMQFSLSEAHNKFITLKEEIHFLQNYMKLEQIRHKDDRVNIEFDFSQIDNLDRQIAPLLLVSFIENAFKHGVNATIGKAFVHLVLQEKDGKLTFNLINNKPGNPVANKNIGGIGLSNVKRRLELEYQNRHTLILKESERHFEVNLFIKLPA